MILNTLFHKNYRDAKTISKRINRLLNNKNFFYKLIENSTNSEELSIKISEIIKYYIISDDKKTNYTYDEVEKIITSYDYNNFNYDKYLENIILANSSNGYAKKNIEKEGLANQNFDKKLSEELEYVEKKLGNSNYYLHQSSPSNNQNYLFFTTPGSLVVNYSMKLAPERLFMGILSQDFPNFLPYKVGEGKKSYYKRLITNKIINNGLEKDEKLKESCNDIIEKLCSQEPIITLFNAKGENYSIKATNSTASREKEQDLSNFINYNSLFLEGRATFSSGGEYSDNAGDLVTTTTNISKNNVGIINMIDFFTYLDIKAKAKGFQNGDEIDILSEDEPKLNSDNIVQVNYGGTGRMYETKLYGSTFLYKPAEKKYTYEQEKFRGIVQECASKVQSLFNSRGAVPCYYIENDTMCGSIQEKITESNQSINYYLAQDDENYIFKEKEIEQFMNEFIVDYLLCNFDSHGNNFITDSYGNIRGIDKEQALKHLDSNYNFLDINCNPNSEYGEKETIYNTIFKRYIKGDIDINFNKLIQNIEKVEQYSDEAYQRIFHRYCTEISKEFNKDYHNLMALILQRKKDIRKNMLTFIQDLKNQRLANTNNNNNNFSNVTSLSMVSPEISPEKAKHR